MAAIVNKVYWYISLSRYYIVIIIIISSSSSSSSSISIIIIVIIICTSDTGKSKLWLFYTM